MVFTIYAFLMVILYFETSSKGESYVGVSQERPCRHLDFETHSSYADNLWKENQEQELRITPIFAMLNHFTLNECFLKLFGSVGSVKSRGFIQIKILANLIQPQILENDFFSLVFLYLAKQIQWHQQYNLWEDGSVRLQKLWRWLNKKKRSAWLGWRCSCLLTVSWLSFLTTGVVIFWMGFLKWF